MSHAGLDDLAISARLQHGEEALRSRGITHEHLVDIGEWRRAWGLLDKGKGEAVLRTRYRDVRIVDVPLEELDGIASELHKRRRYAAFMDWMQERLQSLGDSWDEIDSVLADLVQFSSELLNGGGSATGPAPWPTMDEVAYHGLAGEFVDAVKDRTEADPVAILIHFLVYFGNAAGAHIGEIADSNWHPPRLDVMVVGETGKARKGTADALVARVFRHGDPVWLSQQKVSGLSSAEGLIDAVRDPDEGEDGEEVEEVDRRLLVVEPEMSRALKVMRRETNPLSEVIRQAFDTGDLSVLNIRGNRRRAMGAHISIIGHITPDALRRWMSDSDIADGFANRFSYFCVRRAHLLPNASEPKGFEKRVGEVGEKVADALAFVEEITGRKRSDRAHGLRRLRRLWRNAEAQKMWEVIYRQVEGNNARGLQGSLTARAAAHILRLSVVYALLDQSKTIGTNHLAAAWAVWRYARDSVVHIFGGQSGDPNLDKLYAAIVNAGDRGLSANAQRKLFARNLSRKDLQRMRDRLESDGSIVTEKVEGKRGRPKTVSHARKDEG